MKVLAADIGGTHTRLGLYEADPESGGRPRELRRATYPSARFRGPLEAVSCFLEEPDEPPTAACLAVAGPVEEDRLHLTNLDWEIDRSELCRELGIERLCLLNDFEAIGRGLLLLRPEEFAVLQEGRPRPQAPIAVIGPGTGLGTGYLTAHGGEYRPYAAEGGHADFAPLDDAGRDLQAWLQARHGRVSWERVLSGPGLVSLYRFLAAREGKGGGFEHPKGGGRPERPHGTAGTDTLEAPAISRRALSGKDPLAVAALDLFVRYLGAQAGNLVLTLGATGGLYVAGGIAPDILPALRRPAFLEAFHNKGRLRSYMERIPIRVVLDTRVGLLGAAASAAEP